MNFVEFQALKPSNLDNKVKFSDNVLKFGQGLHGIDKDYVGITPSSVHRITRVVAPSD